MRVLVSFNLLVWMESISLDIENIVLADIPAG